MTLGAGLRAGSLRSAGQRFGMALADTIADLETSIAGWAAKLAADSVNPQPSYTQTSPQGNSRSVSRKEWRDGLLANIREARSLVATMQPFYVKTRQIP